MDSEPDSSYEATPDLDTDDADNCASPIERPPSCHPALMADDDFRDAYVANQLSIFHRDLCERLEQVLLAQQTHRISRKRKRDSDASDSRARSVASDRRQRRRRDDSLDSLTTATTHSSVDSVGTEDGDACSRIRFTHNTYASPVSSLSPYSFHGDAPVKAPDFSWWRPLTPTPPATPKMMPLEHGLAIHRLDCRIEGLG